MASDVQIAKWASQAGFRGPQLVTAVAVALAESGGRTGVYNGICCYGLWQIHRVHGYSVAEMKDGLSNAKMAFKISSGGTNWQPWEAYTNGAYKKYESRAKKAVANMAGGNSSLSPDDIVDAGTGGPDLGAATAIGNLASTVRRLVAGLTDGAIWIRAALVILGGILLLAGLATMMADIGLSSGTFNKISKVIPG